MNPQIRTGLLRVVGLAIIGASAAGYFYLHRPPPQPLKFYTPRCAEVVLEEWKNLDDLCATFASEEEFDQIALEPLLKRRDQRLTATGCNPQDEIWSCYPGHLRHYAQREPNRTAENSTENNREFNNAASNQGQNTTTSSSSSPFQYHRDYYQTTSF